MNEQDAPRPALARSVFHPTDFSDGAEVAFDHALAIALRERAKLTLLHVGDEARGDRRWEGFPSVRSTLERWGRLEPGSPRSAVFDELKLRVEKVAVQGADVLDGLLGFLRNRPADLLVLATHGRDGVPRFLRGSVSEPLARHAKTLTLFVPPEAHRFVSGEDGRVALERVLLPVDHRPDPDAAVESAVRYARALAGGPTRITLLHVGPAPMPEPDVPDDDAVTWVRLRREGAVVETILEAASSTSADLVVMVTAGHDGILDALRGSTTERVLRHAPCPVLAVPASALERGV